MHNTGEILQLCRLCLVKEQVNVPIFEGQGDVKQIFQKISSCLPVKINRSDKLPKNICDGCSEKLDLFYDFWNTSVNSEKQLLEWLGQTPLSAGAGTTIAAKNSKSTDPVQQIKVDVKQEPSDHTDNNESFQADASAVADEDETSFKSEGGPPPKRARRAATKRKPITVAPDTDDDDDDDYEPVEPLTKLEDESGNSDNDNEDDSFANAPSTSADDQPGPSGIGKDGVEAPLSEIPVLETSCKLEQEDDDDITIVYNNIDIIEIDDDDDDETNNAPATDSSFNRLDVKTECDPNLDVEDRPLVMDVKEDTSELCEREKEIENGVDELHDKNGSDDDDDDDEDRGLVIDLPEAEKPSCSNKSKKNAKKCKEKAKKEEMEDITIKDKDNGEDEASKSSTSSSNSSNVKSKDDKESIKRHKVPIRPNSDKEVPQKSDTKNKLDRLCLCIPCKFTLYKSDTYRSQLKSHFRSQCKFKCCYCFKHYRSFSTMVKHLGIHIAQDQSNLAYKCVYCPKSFEDCFQLKRHTYTAHPKHYQKIFTKPESSVKDLVEERQAAEAQMLDQVMEPQEEEVKKITCDECFDEFDTKKQYKKHKELHRSIAADRKSKPAPMPLDDDYMEIFEDATNSKYEIVTTISTKRGQSNGFINY